MDINNRMLLRFGLGLCAFSVLMGAFAAHLLKDEITQENIYIFDTGTKYMFYHALAISFLSLSFRKFKQEPFELAISLFIIGIFLFTGSLYALSTRSLWGGENLTFIGGITPIGGIMLMLGWVVLLTRGLKEDDPMKMRDSRSRGRKSGRPQRLKDDPIIP